MKPISGKRMCQVLKKHGWKHVRTKGSHHSFKKTGNVATITVPIHRNKDLKPGTQRAIMNDAGLAEEDL